MCTTKAVLGIDEVRPYDGEQHQVALADGWVVLIEWKTCTLTATIMTPWVPIVVRLALAVMPGENDLLILGPKTLPETLDIDVMKQLRDTAAASGGGASSMDHAPAEVPTMPPGVIGVRRVAVTMEAMQQGVTSSWRLLGKPMGSRTRCWIGGRR